MNGRGELASAGRREGRGGRHSVIALSLLKICLRLFGLHWYWCFIRAHCSLLLLLLRAKQELGDESSMVFVKGDANYRRLIGDRLWPTDTPFPDVAGYFPARLCALRTLKAELG